MKSLSTGNGRGEKTSARQNKLLSPKLVLNGIIQQWKRETGSGQCLHQLTARLLAFSQGSQKILLNLEKIQEHQRKAQEILFL